LKHTITNSEGETTHLLLRKGIYPYEHINSFDRFDETSIPPKEAFYSRLTRDGISDADYQHAQTVWQEFKCETLGDYHDIYLRMDVLLLADVFQTLYLLRALWSRPSPLLQCARNVMGCTTAKDKGPARALDRH